MSKGGSSPQSTVTTQVEKLPVELVPFYEDLLGRGVYESLTGYETYPFRRLADFDPYEAGAQQAYQEMAEAGTPQTFTEAQRGFREVAGGTPYQRAIQGDEVTQELARQLGQYATTRPQFSDLDMTAQDFTKAGVQDDYLLDPDDLAYDDIAVDEVGDLDEIALDDVALDQFRDEGILESYMNPYQQQFLDRQKRLAREESEAGANQIAAQATMAGGLGGYREGIMQSERERNLGEQLQDIQSRGDMENYLQARQAFEQDRAADFQSQQANVLSDLQAQQANVQSDWQAQQANVQSDWQAQQANLQADLEAQQANVQSALQFGEADRQVGFQDIGQARQQFEQDRLADMQRAEFNRQGLAEQADIAMRGYQTLGGDIDRRMSAADRMAGLAGTRQAMEYDRLGQLEAAGTRRRGLAQQGLDIGYQDFLRQQAFPREQLNLYSGLLRGVPVGPGQYTNVYGNQPTATQQLVGAGISGIGAFNSLTGGGGWGGQG